MYCKYIRPFLFSVLTCLLLHWMIWKKNSVLWNVLSELTGILHAESDALVRFSLSDLVFSKFDIRKIQLTKKKKSYTICHRNRVILKVYLYRWIEYRRPFFFSVTSQLNTIARVAKIKVLQECRNFFSTFIQMSYD